MIINFRYKPEVVPDKLANGSPILDQDIGKFMAVPFVLANVMAMAQDGFQIYLSENRSSFLRDLVVSRFEQISTRTPQHGLKQFTLIELLGQRLLRESRVFFS